MREAVEAAARFQRVAQLEALGERRRRGLVGEHVKAVLERGRRDDEVQIVRRDDRDELHALVGRQLGLGREHRVEVGVAALGRQSQARTAAPAALGVARERAADELERLVETRSGAMHGADECAFAAADHAESDFPHGEDSSLRINFGAGCSNIRRSRRRVRRVANENYDAIVVGSGISGGWAAKELTEKGLTVLLLERGKNIEHAKDYVNAHKGPWEYPHRGGRTYAMEEAYPVLRRDYPLNERNLDWWVNEKDSPYTEVKRFDWYRGYHVGGRSLLWGRQSYRWSDFDFEANAREGIAIDWPIRYAELAPWYDYVERHAGIAGSIEGMAQLPDGQFQPAMPLNCGEELMAGRVRGLFDGRRRIIPGRVANLTQALPGRSPCQYRNACVARLPVRRVFQLAIVDIAGRNGDGAAHAEAVLDRRPKCCTTAIGSAPPGCASSTP